MLKKIFSSQFFSGSLVVILGTGLAGLASYFYHLLMGRMLGPVDYGLLASLISLIYLLGIPTTTLNLVLVKFVSSFKGQKDFPAIAYLFKVTAKKILPISLFFLLIFLILAPSISKFLHLPSMSPFILILLTFFISIFLVINRAFLQGLLRFGHFSFSSILEPFLKLSLGFLLVWWGFRINGALFGMVVGSLVCYIYTFIPLRSIFNKKESFYKFNSQEIIKFALPVFFSSLAFTSLYTTDLILVRHFLPEQSGFYAALATLGKMIFFVNGSIVSVSFPLISERYANGSHYRHLFWLSFLLIFLISGVISLFYFLFPSLMISLLYGHQYLPAASLLGFFGVFLSFYSLCFLIVNFFLSINRTKAVIFPVAAGVLQIIFISFFHQNLKQIVLISVVLLALLLLSLLIYCLQYLRNK